MVSVDHGELDKVNVHQVLNTDTQELTYFKTLLLVIIPVIPLTGVGGTTEKGEKHPTKSSTDLSEIQFQTLWCS